MILQADQTQLEIKIHQCDEALIATEKELELRKSLRIKDQEYQKILENQRNKAYDQLKDQGSLLPWYFWAILGTAGGVILTRGIR